MIGGGKLKNSNSREVKKGKRKKREGRDKKSYKISL